MIFTQVVVYGQGREGGDTQCYFEKGVLSSIQHILILLSSSTYWWLRTWKIQDKQYITNPSKVTISGYKLDDPRQCLSRWNTVVRRKDFQNTYFLNTTTLVAFSPPIVQMLRVAWAGLQGEMFLLDPFSEGVEYTRGKFCLSVCLSVIIFPSSNIQ